MFTSKKIVRYGTGGHIVLPRSKVGLNAIVIYDDEVQDFRDMIKNAYMLNRVNEDRIRELKEEIEEMKTDVRTRLSWLESSLTWLLDKDNRSTSSNTESKSSSPELFSSDTRSK